MIIEETFGAGLVPNRLLNIVKESKNKLVFKAWLICRGEKRKQLSPMVCSDGSSKEYRLRSLNRRYRRHGLIVKTHTEQSWGLNAKTQDNNIKIVVPHQEKNNLKNKILLS